MKVKPVRCVAVIKPNKVDDKSKGGIYIPEQLLDRLQVACDRGELMAVGEGFFEGLQGPVPQIGQKVLFDKYAGSLIQLDVDGKRENFRLCNDDKIIAILEE